MFHPTSMGNLISVILRPCYTWIGKTCIALQSHSRSLSSPTMAIWIQSPNAFLPHLDTGSFHWSSTFVTGDQLPESLCYSSRFCHLPRAQARQSSIFLQVENYVLCHCPSLSLSRTLDSSNSSPCPPVRNSVRKMGKPKVWPKEQKIHLYRKTKKPSYF